MAYRIQIKGIASYPHLNAPHRAGRPGQQQGEPKYSVNVILDDDNNWEEINGALAAEAANLGVTDLSQWPPGARWPLKQYTEQDAPRPDMVGKYYVSASSGDRVPVVDHNVLPYDSPDKIKSEVYPGAKIIAHVNVAFYKNISQGITFYLNGVQKIGEGPRLDDRPTVNQMFKAQTPQNAAGFDPSAMPGGAAAAAAAAAAGAQVPPGMQPAAQPPAQPAAPQPVTQPAGPAVQPATVPGAAVAPGGPMAWDGTTPQQ